MTSIEQPTTKKHSLEFKNFDDIVVSTKTFIINTNLVIDLKKLFEFLPISDFVVIPKRRGRKKHKEPYVDPNPDIINGSIVTLKYENKMRGVDLKAKKSHTKKRKTKWFRNSFTVVIILDNKPVNFKVCHNGMFQITGVKFDKQAEDCVHFIWSFIKDTENIYSFSSGDFLDCIIIPAMRNIDFSLGFNVDREKLARYIARHSDFHSLLETSFGYTGVNIKIPITNDIKKLMLKKLSFKDDEVCESFISYGDYITILPDKDRNKKINKIRYNTFLAFHSGKVIQSGINSEFMRDSYEYFLNIIRGCYEEIVEKLDV